MDTTCTNNYGSAARAATNDELMSGAIQGLPGANTSNEHLIVKCPNCAGGNTSWCVDGHGRNCVDPGASWPPSFNSGWNDNCQNSNRSTICVN